MAHAGGEVEQTFLAGVGGVAAEGFVAGTDADALAVEVDVAAFGAVLLDDLPRRAFGLVADEQDVVALPNRGCARRATGGCARACAGGLG